MAPKEFSLEQIRVGHRFAPLTYSVSQDVIEKGDLLTVERKDSTGEDSFWVFSVRGKNQCGEGIVRGKAGLRISGHLTGPRR